MRNTFRFIVVIMVMMVLSSSLMAATKGDGNVVKQKRTLNKEFDGVIVSQGILVYITYGGEFSLVVEADENIQDQLITEVTKEGHLRIYFEGDVKKITSRNVYLTTSNLKLLKAITTAKIEVKNTIKRDEIHITSLSGSNISVDIDVENAIIYTSRKGLATIIGVANNLKVKSSSASCVYAFDLISQNCKANSDRLSHININVSEKLEANARLKSMIVYKGKPEKIKVKTSLMGYVSAEE